jgi:hypothetical protein
MRRSALALVLLGLFSGREAFAQPFGLTELSVDKRQTSPITIVVSTKGTPPLPTELEDPKNWRLNMTTAAASPQIGGITAKWIPGLPGVNLTFDRQEMQGAALADVGWRVTYLGGLNLSVSLKSKEEDPYKTAKSKEAAFFYLFGSILVGPSTKPIHVFDLKYAPAFDWKRGWFVGGKLEASSNTTKEPPVNKVTIDPDSIKAALTFTKNTAPLSRAVHGLTYTLSPAAGEFARKDFTSTYVAAAQLQVNFVPIAKAFTVYPRAGYEAGHVITRPKKIADQPVVLTDWSAISRAVFGVAAEWTFFKPELVEDDWYHVTVGATYNARVLFAPEPSVEPGMVDGKLTPVTTVEKGTRHLAEASLDWNVMKFTAVSLKYKYGAQPPLFKLVDHQWVFGITIKAAKK